VSTRGVEGFGRRWTLKQWADERGVNVLRMRGRGVLVDKCGGGWFAPQWWTLPHFVYPTGDERAAYDQRVGDQQSDSGPPIWPAGDGAA
jgi:hypothetical protein